MTCPSTEELSALYDGNLKLKHAQRLRDHLSQCPRCAQEVASLHQALKAIKAAPPVNGELVARGVRLAMQLPPIKVVKPRPAPRGTTRRSVREKQE